MFFPTFPKKNDLLGICAPSAGIGHKEEAYDHSIATLKRNGFRVTETEHVRVNDPRGGTAEERGSELTSLFLEDEVKAVLSAAGGDFLYEVLPHINWRVLKNHPKWMAGASDPTSILFTYTTKYDVATLYGFNAGSFDDDPLPPYLIQALNILKGKTVIQHTSKLYASKPSFAIVTATSLPPDLPKMRHSFPLWRTIPFPNTPAGFRLLFELLIFCGLPYFFLIIQ